MVQTIIFWRCPTPKPTPTSISFTRSPLQRPQLSLPSSLKSRLTPLFVLLPGKTELELTRLKTSPILPTATPPAQIATNSPHHSSPRFIQFHSIRSTASCLKRDDWCGYNNNVWCCEWVWILTGLIWHFSLKNLPSTIPNPYQFSPITYPLYIHIGPNWF